MLFAYYAWQDPIGVSKAIMSQSRRPFDDLPARACDGGLDLLAGVTVLDLTTSIAGPYATMLLGDLGARVIKLERPGQGDDARAWGPPFLDAESLWFLAVNRNKESLTLDQRQAEGRRIFEALLAKADVLVTNQPPAVQRKLDLDYDSLKALKPDLVFTSLTGFGLKGRRAEQACYDLIAEGYSGVMDLTGAPDRPPQKVGAPAADLLAGQDAALATLAALFARQRDGKGRLVDVALVESMTRFMACRILPYLGSGEVPARSGGTDSVIAVYQTFDTADEPITLGLGSDAIWKRFWASVGRPERGLNPAEGSNAKRRAKRADLVAEIQQVLLARGRADWLQAFADARVPAGPINRVDEVAADPDLIERGLFYRLESEAGSLPQVGLGIQFDGAAVGPRLPPPRLGQHKALLLREFLGYDEAKTATLAAAGTI
ncbi:MAG: CoA transferase [Rhodospirillales bacterium]